jgi:hypothetical protein
MRFLKHTLPHPIVVVLDLYRNQLEVSRRSLIRLTTAACSAVFEAFLTSAFIPKYAPFRSLYKYGDCRVKTYKLFIAQNS